MNEPSNELANPENTCCGGPAIKNDQACCRQDEVAKNTGKKGCGCSDQTEKPSNTNSCCQ